MKKLQKNYLNEISKRITSSFRSLSEITEENLEGKQGKILFESTIKSKLNELMQEGEVQQVYITSYIIQ